MEYTVTVISKSNVSHQYVVKAKSADEAMDKVFDMVSYDIREAYCDNEYFC